VVGRSAVGGVGHAARFMPFQELVESCYFGDQLSYDPLARNGEGFTSTVSLLVLVGLSRPRPRTHIVPIMDQ